MENIIINLLKNNILDIENTSIQNQIHKWKYLQAGLFNTLPLDIQEKKPFIKTDKGWQWFKNLVIPTIKVQSKNKSIQKKTKIEEDILQSELQQTQLNNRIFKSRLDCFKKLNSHTFEKVEINGQLDKQMTQDFNVSFKSLKFEETSFMTRSNYFVIVVTVYEEDLTNKQFNIRNIFASPMLSVDARKKYWSERQAQVSIFDPFLPSLADKFYEKVCKKDGSRQSVNNDLQGIENYFTSYSIRHKIRNPFFLLLKFPLGISFYYNTNIIKPNQTQENLILQLHKEVYKCFMQEMDEDISVHNKLIYLSLNARDDDMKVKESVQKISKYLSSLDGPVLTFSQYQTKEIPENFQKLEFNEQLKDSYKKVYNKLFSLKFQIKDEETNQKQMQSLTQLPSQLTAFDILDSPNNYDQNKMNNIFQQTIVQTDNKLGTVIDLCIKNPQHRQNCEKIKVIGTSSTTMSNSNQKKSKNNNNKNQDIEEEEPQKQKFVKSNPNLLQYDSLNNIPYDNNFGNILSQPSFTQLNMNQMNINSYSDISQQSMKFEHPQEQLMLKLQQQFNNNQNNQSNCSFTNNILNSCKNNSLLNKNNNSILENNKINLLNHNNLLLNTQNQNFNKNASLFTNNNQNNLFLNTNNFNNNNNKNKQVTNSFTQLNNISNKSQLNQQSNKVNSQSQISSMPQLFLIQNSQQQQQQNQLLIQQQQLQLQMLKELNKKQSIVFGQGSLSLNDLNSQQNNNDKNTFQVPKSDINLLKEQEQKLSNINQDLKNIPNYTKQEEENKIKSLDHIPEDF